MERNFTMKKFAVILAYLILLCTVTAVSAKKIMSNVADSATVLQKLKNNTAGIDEAFKKCLICGRSHAGPEENMISGDKVDPPNKYPWMVRVKSGTNFCGGAILHSHYILTAAHCLFNSDLWNFWSSCYWGWRSCKRSPNEVEIELLTDEPDMYTGGPPVENIFTHGKFDGGDYNDIAIVKLKDPITCDAFASPICLPPSNFTFPAKTMLSVAGWGVAAYRDLEDGDLTPTQRLLEANVMVVNVSNCIGKYFVANPDPEAGLYCVTGMEEKTPCKGDSGGPMFLQEEVFYAIGVTSAHTSTTCDRKMPVMYTAVPTYVNYIHDITGLQSAHEIEVPRNGSGEQ